MDQHVTFSTVGRVPLWRTPTERLHLVRALARIGGARLALFCVVDDHAHVLFAGDEREALAFGRAINWSWSRLAGVKLAPSDRRVVEDRAHLLRLVDYIHRQPVRHALGEHPGRWSGSSLWDLLGARALPGFDPAAVRAVLPRLVGDHLRRSAAIPSLGRVGAEEVIQAMGVAGALAAVADALACDLHRDRALAAGCRAVVVRLAGDTDVRQRRVAAELGLTDRAVRRLRDRPLDSALQAVVERHLALRVALRSAPLPAPTDSERRAIERSRVLAGSGEVH